MMKPTRAWQDVVINDTHTTRIRHRNWREIRMHAAVCIVLLIIGFFAGAPIPRLLALAGAALAGAAMLAFHYIERLRLERTPRR